MRQSKVDHRIAVEEAALDAEVVGVEIEARAAGVLHARQRPLWIADDEFDAVVVARAAQCDLEAYGRVEDGAVEHLADVEGRVIASGPGVPL